jgi:hypothetical protein
MNVNELLRQILVFNIFVASPAIAYGIVNSVERFSKHPHLRRATAHSPNGDVKYVDVTNPFI